MVRQEFIKIDPVEFTELEKYYYEVNSRRDLVSYMLEHEMVESNNEQFNKFFDEYQEFYYICEKYKGLISNKYTNKIPGATT